MPDAEQLIQSIRAWLRSDLRILRWVFLVLYVVLVTGLFLISFVGVASLMLLGALFFMQALFILGAGTMELCRPIRKRRLWLPVMVAALMLAALVGGLFVALSELFYLERVVPGDSWDLAFWIMVIGSWVLWGVLLWVRVRRWRRMRVLTRLSVLLFAGSLAELVAAATAHAIVSRRPGCFVGLGTAIGILAGAFVMLFSFGPMIVLLFLRPRYRQEREEAEPTCDVCGAYLRGALAMDQPRCPACGARL
jgi:hypothetical protein